MKSIILSIITISTVAFSGCNSSNTNTAPPQNKAEGQAVFAAETSDQFNAYWYAGKAEISSYNYVINRYGQDRKGYAVFVFVTEDLSNAKQVKLDDPAKAGNDRVPVLKLNAVQRFKTGIYDYSMMSSLFTPVDFKNMPHALKYNTTVQDWCGQVFTQMNLRGKEYKVEQFSYFETEGDQKIGVNTEGMLLEDELLSRLRLDPSSLPTKVKLVPNLTFSRIRHKKVEALPATLSFADGQNGMRTLTAKYDNGRRMEIDFEGAFPHKILRFAEFDGSTKLSEGTLKKTVMSDYWMRNGNEYESMRDELGI